ncbi:hypothetical protein [Kribbella sp. CA-293567]|uniref:hypothetical protein n=1 Tax=Kribbella sp. CA-293567 TaxID=3002436 RepID=UPI0022DDD426|nr:hypothetical protein [Kribbella sp. CA-293567]WBQ01807.1 hypothetical protein OX958_17565 [Kribbella sp. CA-293567]
MSTPGQGDLAEARAREALGIALGVVAPSGVRLRDGRFRLDAKEVLPAEAVTGLDTRLRRRAADRASDERLLAESVALVGAEIARIRGLEPADGAIAALDRLLHIPGLQEARRVEAEAMLRSVLESAAVHSETAAARLATLPGQSRQVGPRDLVSAARQIQRGAQLLSHQPAAVAAQSTGTALPITPPPRSAGRHRAQVGARHRRGPDARTTTPQVRGSGLVTGIGGRPALDPDLTEGSALAALRQLGQAELGGMITSRPAIDAQARLAVLDTAVSDAPQHVRVEILPTGRGLAAEGRLRSGTQNDPHILRLSPRLADEQLAQVWVHQLSQLTQQLDPTNAGQRTGVLSKLRSVLGHEKRDRGLNADYASYRFLTASWHRARAQVAANGRPAGPHSVADLERDLEALATSIRKRGGVAPALPWAADAIHVPGAAAAGTVAALAVRAEATALAPYTPAALRLQVADAVSGLQSEVQELEGLATAKEDSSTAAGTEALTLTADAAIERTFKDKGAPERARVIEGKASGAARKTVRHTQLAEGYRNASVAAAEALASQRNLLAELDAAIADPNRPQAAIATLAKTAVERADAYRTAADEALPVKDVLHTGVPGGRPPALPVSEIDQVLGAHGISARLADGTGPLPLPDAAYRRVLSPEGIEFTVGGSPDSDVTELAQVRLRLKPRDIRENLDRDYELAEQMSGTIGDGGQSISTTAAHSASAGFGVNAKPVMELAPPGSTVQLLSQVAAPRVDVSSGWAHSESSSSSSHDKQGAVDDDRGESVQVGWTGEWEIEVRASATDPWRPAQTFDAGKQLTWVSAAYTVKPPAETVTLAELGRADEIEPAFPRHTVTHIDGLNSVRDRLVAGGRERFGPIDKVAYEQINGLVTENVNRLLRQTSRPGGYGREIVSAGEGAYHVQLELEPIWSTAKLSGEASPDLWQEEVQVGFNSVSASQGFSSSASASLGVSGGFKDLGATSLDLGPSVSAGRAVSRQGGLNVSATSITPVVHRNQGPTQGVVVGFGVRATLRKLGDPKAEPVVVSDFCDARLRVPESDLLRAGGRVDKAAVLRNADGTPRLNQDGKLLLRGDPEPATGVQTLPPVIGAGERQLRGAGQALVQDFTGDREALEQTLANLSREGLVPPLDRNFQPVLDQNVKPAYGAHPSDRRLRSGQLTNYDRVIQHLSAERLEAGYNQAAQSGIPMVLIDQRTGRAPQYRTFRIAVVQDFQDVNGEGTSTTDNVVRLGIASDASGRSGGRSRGVPLSGGAGVGDGPEEGVRGLAGRIGLKLSRNALGRSFSWSAGRRVNRVSLTESTGPVDKLRTGHRILVTEITRDGDSAALADARGSAKLLIDSALTRAAEPAHAAQPKAPSAAAVKQSMPVHVDAGNPVDRIASAVDALELGSSSYLELHAMLAPDSLVAHNEWMNGEYRLPLTIVPPAGNPVDAVRQGTVLPRGYSVVVRGEAIDRTFVAVTEQNSGDINFTMKDTSFTSGRSASGGVGADGGGGPVRADGASVAGSASVARSGGRAQSTTNSQTMGEEGLLVNVGTHYQSLDRYRLVAEISDAEGNLVHSVPLQDAKALTTTPERRALRLYGQRELDLPFPVVEDAAERYLAGKLKISPRDAAAFVRRYKQEKAGVSTGLAAEHTDERLSERVLDHAKGEQTPAPPAALRLDETLSDVEQTAGRQREMTLPPQYDVGLASSQIEDISPPGRPGEQVDLLNPALRQVEELAPGLLATNSMLRSALTSDLGTDGWHGHLNDMYGVRGFVAEIEVPVAGQPNPDLIVVRVNGRYAGPILVDGTPELPEVDAIGLKQNYDYVGEDQSVSHTTTYSAGAEVKGSIDTSLSAGASTARTRTVAAKRGRLNTHLDRTGHFQQAEIQRDATFEVQVSRVHNAGAATMAGLRWRINRTLPSEQTVHATPATVQARMTLMVPRELLKPADPDQVAQPQQSVVEISPDHRSSSFRFPDGAAAEAMIPHGKGRPAGDQLYQQIRAAMVERIGEAAMRDQQVALEGQLSPTALCAAVKRLTGDRGLQLTPIADRGNGRTAYVVVVKARPQSWELQDNPLPGGQSGQVARSQHSTGVTTTGNQLMATGNGGAGGGPFNVGGSVGKELKEQGSDSHGTRLETSRFSEGDLATVEASMAYSVTVYEVADTGRGVPKVKDTEQLPEQAEAVYWLKMLQHEALDGIRQLETGATVTPQLAAVTPTPARAELRQTEYGVDAAGNNVHQPYRPLLTALNKAVAEKRTVTLAVQEADGAERNYLAGKDGTLREVGDGSGYAEAFSTLHPTIALMCEGRVDLRALHNSLPRTESFNGKVTEALERSGVPLSMLKGLDHSATVRHLAAKPGQGERQPIGGAATGRAAAAPGHGPSLAGP